ncbi:hypothetical protein AKO1_013669 [Acrasis kona]|uniref:F-box domain-containing protein n=1 Tax=Acrasis kona TaxID=1008807 RepID=A0AAW2YP32_9EUKA
MKRRRISEDKYAVQEVEWTYVLPKEIFCRILCFLGVDAWPVITTSKSLYYLADNNEYGRYLVAQLLEVDSALLSSDDDIMWGRHFKILTKNHMKSRVEPEERQTIKNVKAMKLNLESLLVQLCFKKFCTRDEIPKWMQLGTIFDDLKLSTYENDCYATVIEVCARWRLTCLTGKVIAFVARYNYASGTCETNVDFGVETSPSIDIKELASHVVDDEESKQKITLGIIKKYISNCLAMTDLNCTESRNGWNYYLKNLDELWEQHEQGFEGAYRGLCV